MSLFSGHIGNWRDWGGIYQSISAFASLVNHILKIENLPPAAIESLSPGTNAVFKAGGYVVKIFAPRQSGVDQTPDLLTELFATRRANALGVSAPRLIADGYIDDKYRFAYMVTEYIEGKEFDDAVKTMSRRELQRLGQKLRRAVDTMNTPCETFNAVDVIGGESRFPVWVNFPDSFNKERVEYKRTHDFGKKVFVHGDLCSDNILVSQDGKIYIIDFADAVLAPAVYEHALVATGLFFLDGDMLRGYFGDAAADDIAEICFDGLLIHAFGGDIIKNCVGNPAEFDSIWDLHYKLEHIFKEYADGTSE